MAQLSSTPTKPWSLSISDVTGELAVAPDRGLDTNEAASRRSTFGSNALREAKKSRALEILVRQFKSLIIALLAAAAATAFAFGEIMDGIAVVVVIIINAAIGFFTELKAVRSMEALNQLSDVSARVLRDGEAEMISAKEMVPGDIVLLEGGDIVTADMRVIEASKLQVNESALTGESMPVDKITETIPDNTVLAERTNMLFKGTEIVRGSGRAVVTSTGMNTELGTISSLVEETEDVQTPLEKKLDKLGNKLIWVVLAIAAVSGAAGIIAGRDLLLMIETAIALAVAAIPEGLPIVATLALARGMWRMAKRNALINHLAAVETLGATTVIGTDKTGTLTENRMIAQHLVSASSRTNVAEADGDAGRLSAAARTTVEIGVLCNNASLSAPRRKDDGAAADEGNRGGAPQGTGDPVEVALLALGAGFGIDRPDLIENRQEIKEEAFDADVKMMATYHQTDDGILVAVKGAPEAVVSACSTQMKDDSSLQLTDQDRQTWLDANEELAKQGLRLLAMARKYVDNTDEEPYADLELVGYVSFLDPPRKEVRESIEQCRRAGIQVVMVTGDQAATAATIASQVGLMDSDNRTVIHGKDWKSPGSLSEDEKRQALSATVFSRFSPRQKMDLIDLHRENGAVVAMTGDGVNDAPALKRADIGVAMGQRGTQVAREAADMVLQDDAFSSIVAAIEQGRIIFENIRTFIIYLLSCNVSEILVLSLASFLSVPLPILPLQILFLNLVTDVFPALALGVGEGDPHVMRQNARDPSEPIVTRAHWFTISGFSAVMSVTVIAALLIAGRVLGFDDTRAVTVSFLTLAFSQLWHVFNMRDISSSPFKNAVTRNPYVWGALALCIALLIGAVYLPVLSDVLRVTNPGANGWLLVIGMSLFPLVVGQIVMILEHARMK